MPLYEYSCLDCQHSFEALVRGGEAPTCPSCNSVKLEKLLSVPAAPSTNGLRDLPQASDFRPCGMGGCGRPECD